MELPQSCAKAWVMNIIIYISSIDMQRGIMLLQWRHNERDSVSNHQPHDCLLNQLFRRRSKKTSKLRVTGLCAGNSPGTGEFPAQMASSAENVSIWWRHHDIRDIYCISSNNALDIMDVCINNVELIDCVTRLSELCDRYKLHVTHLTVIIWQEQDPSQTLIVKSI